MNNAKKQRGKNRMGKTRDLFKKIGDIKISCKDGHGKGQKGQGLNRNRRD